VGARNIGLQRPVNDNVHHAIEAINVNGRNSGGVLVEYSLVTSHKHTTRKENGIVIDTINYVWTP